MTSDCDRRGEAEFPREPWGLARALVSCLASILLSGCASTSLMDGIIASWKGAPLSEVVQRWGLPSQEMTVGGQKYYVWAYQKSGFIPQSSTTTGVATNNGVINTQTSTAGGYAFSAVCERILQVDGNDIVVGGSWRGNNCPFMEAFEYSTWRNPRTGRE
jgi:hypothetical protein